MNTSNEIKSEITLGLDIGSSRVKIALLTSYDNSLYLNSKIHYGDIKNALAELLKQIPPVLSNSITKIALSGTNESLELKEIIKSAQIKEVLSVPCLDKACEMFYPQTKTILEVGAQNAKYIKRKGESSNLSFFVTEGCASGTGAFLEQQVSRVGFELDVYKDVIEKDKKYPTLSGHCSVFTKTDIIHRQQEGYSSKEILAGICFATVRNIKTNLIKSKEIATPLVLSGFVSKNEGIVKALQKIFNLQDTDIIYDENTAYLQAIGTALLARENTYHSDFTNFLALLEQKTELASSGISYSDKLVYQPVKKDLDFTTLLEDKVYHCTLGIDVGSTSVNLVLLTKDKELVSAQYLRTAGKPKEVVTQGIENIKNEFGARVVIDEIGVTGSGRHIVAKMLDAKTIKDEITAQAKAASFVEPNVDTVFEIGGQDSKYISIKNKEVEDFQMNKICAAGTGSFLEEQAKYLDVKIEEYATLALQAERPVELGERCTVFIENKISSCLALGVDKKDILAGLCHSVIRNYLGKVVGNRKVGSTILLQGGVCYNDAVVAAFQHHYGDKIKVSPIFQVSGAFGVALLALESIERSKNKVAIENDLLKENKQLFLNSKNFLTSCIDNSKKNNTKTIGIPMTLMFYRNFPFIYTFLKELGFNVVSSGKTDENIVQLSQEISTSDTCYPIKLAHGHIKKLVDMKLDYILLPRVFGAKVENRPNNAKFEKSMNRGEHKKNSSKSKGFLQKALPHLIEILPASISGSLAEKMMNKQGKQGDNSHSACPFMQALPELIKNANFNNSSEFLEIDMADMMSSTALQSLAQKLGKNENECKKASDKAYKAYMSYMVKLKKLQENFISKIKADEKVLVIVTRFYNLADKILEMGIVEELLKFGYKIISSSHLPLKEMAKEALSMKDYPFGHHMLIAGEFIKNNPNYYPIYLTNHACGHDTMISHEFAEIIGDRPCLSIEIDEHFSKVGVVTRIEAFLNSIDQQENTLRTATTVQRKKIKDIQSISTSDEKPLYIPCLFPYSSLLARHLRKQNFIVHELPKQTEQELKLAYDKCNSKEYLSFIYNLMDSVYLDENKKAGTLLSLRNKESDADAMFAQIISNMSGNKLDITSFYFEELFTKQINGKELFYSFLAGDIIMTAPKEKREELLQFVLKQAEITEETALGIISQIQKEEKKKVLFIGEPKVLFNAKVQEEMFEKIDTKADINIQFMPMTEYILVLSKGLSKEEKLKYQMSIDKVSSALGSNSPFIQNRNNLKAVITENLPKFTAGNGAYRYGKALNSQNYAGIVSFSSLHENTQTVLSSLDYKNKPFLSLSYDGRDYTKQKEKLNSFLYYL